MDIYDFDDIELEVAKHSSSLRHDAGIHHCIREVIKGKKSHKEYAKCITTGHITFVCKELKICNSFEQEWKNRVFDEEVDRESISEVESQSYDWFEGTGNFLEYSSISLFGETEPFPTVNVEFTYFEDDRFDFDFFDIYPARENNSLSIMFKLTNKTYQKLFEDVQNKNAKELLITINPNNVECFYEDIFESDHADNVTFKIMDRYAYRHLEEKYSEEQLKECKISNYLRSSSMGTQFQYRLSEKVGSFDFIEQKIFDDDLEIDEVKEDYLTEEQKLEVEKIKREKQLIELETNKNKTLNMIFWAVVVIGLAIAFL